MSLHHYAPDVDWGDVGKYALIGACAQLAGTVRLTYSLTAIVIEAIGNLTYLFPILMTVVVSKHLAGRPNDVFLVFVCLLLKDHLSLTSTSTNHSLLTYWSK